jgi:hypothetical protein
LSYNGMYWSGYFNIRPTFGKKRKKNWRKSQCLE